MSQMVSPRTVREFSIDLKAYQVMMVFRTCRSKQISGSIKAPTDFQLASDYYAFIMLFQKPKKRATAIESRLAPPQITSGPLHSHLSHDLTMFHGRKQLDVDSISKNNSADHHSCWLILHIPLALCRDFPSTTIKSLSSNNAAS
jgi:hypothetical protein